MGDKRKLQAEIDRCLKKVTEGVEAFDDIWKKVYSSNNTNQKEKFEADLKKEIKKLQRLRDQIKSWLMCGEIKDKQVLSDHRKIIEQQMERFKVIERETKMKAYSKEGLILTGKVDPKEKEKEDINNWLSTSIGELEVQVDKLESEMEALNTRKKKLDREETARFETCKDILGKHQYHIDRLETILRMVDNGALQFSQITKIQDDVDYYIESNQDAIFEGNEYIYDELNLDDLMANLRADVMASSPSEADADAGGTGPSSNHSGSPSPSLGTCTHSKKSEDDTKKRHKSQDDGNLIVGRSNLSLKTNLSDSSTNSLSSSRLPQTPTKSNTLSSVPSTPTSAGVSSVRQMAASVPPVQGLGYAQVAGSHHSNSSGKALPSIAKSHANGTNGMIVMPPNLFQSLTPTAAATTTSAATSSSSAASGHSSSSTVPAAGVSGHLPSSLSSSSTSASATMSAVPNPSPLSVVSTTVCQPLQLSALAQQQQQQLAMDDGGRTDNGVATTTTTATHSLQNEANGPLSQLKSFSHESQEQWPGPEASSASSLGQTHLDPSLDMPTSLQLSSISLAPSNDSLQTMSQQLPPISAPVTHTIFLNPIYGVSPLGPQQSTDEQVFQQMMLDVSSRHLPLHTDSETVRVYLPNNPCPTPLYYPQVLPHIMQSADFFSKLDADSLFFIFYYMEGTKAQYLAAKALKQKSWRFHMRYMMWFQRHEEPKAITDEYEQGTYIYFDYEKWAQRKKEGFKFEYKFLEDNDL